MPSHKGQPNYGKCPTYKGGDFPHVEDKGGKGGKYPPMKPEPKKG